jgi:RHS repeat-associated protein
MRIIEAIFRIGLFLFLFFFICVTYTASIAPAQNAFLDDVVPPTLTLTSIPSADNYTFTGAATTSIPIIVAPGRGGIAPSLALQYSSYRDNGWVGLGWDLDMGAIQRSTKFGLDYNADKYVFVKNSSQTELVLRTEWATGVYGTKIEGAFTKYTFNPGTGGWEAIARDGTKYFYGQTAASRQDSTAGVFKWCLDRVEDVHGNYLTVTYSKDQGEIYLEQINYTGNTDGLTAKNYVKFYLEDRPDQYTSAFVKTAKRLKTIEVNAGGSRVRAYKLSYTQSQGTARSLLSTVQQFGTDAAIDASGTVTGGSALPPITATYPSSSENTTFASFVGTSVTSYGYGCFNDDSRCWQFAFADVNGDHKTDAIAYFVGDNWFVVQVALAKGDGTFQTPFIPSTLSNADYIFWNFTFADINGDGRTDAVAYYTGNGVIYVDVALANENGTFAPFVHQTLASSGYNGWKFTFADINGDGRLDAVAYSAPDAVYVDVALAREDGTFASFVRSTLATSGYAGWAIGFVDINGDGCADAVVRYSKFYVALSRRDGTFAPLVQSRSSGWGSLIDINGDGRADSVSVSVSTTMYKVYAYLGKGDGDFGSVGESGESILSTANYTGWKSSFADINGDGKPDLLASSIGSGVYVHVALNKGDGTFSPFIPTTLAGSGYGCDDLSCWQFTFVDVDGDGKADAVGYFIGGDDHGAHLHVALSQYPAPNLMSSISNGGGAFTNYTYTPSNAYQNSRFPSIIHMVSRIMVDDGYGNQAATNYTYQGGLYDFATREFRGFAQVKIEDEVTGLVTETHYHQDEVFQGRVAWSETRDANNALVSRVDNTWDKQDYDNDSAFPYLTQAVATKYDDAGGALGSVTMLYTYDDYGSVLTESKATSDGYSRSTQSQYLNDTDNWVLGKPTHVTTSGPGTRRETRMQYTNDVRHLLQYQKRVHNGAEYTTSYQYDPYGNVQLIINPRNVQTFTEYDANSIYPVATHYDYTGLNHTISKTFDPRFGTVLSETDVNNQTTAYTYDKFGRQSYVSYPDKSWKRTTYHIEPGNHYIIVQSSNAPDAITFYDNLARTVEEQTRASDGTVIAASTVYDEAGRISAKSLPFFAGHTAEYTTYDYDLRSRLQRQTKPDGTIREMRYSGLIETAIDENGRSKTTTKDLLGRVLKVEEAIGSFAEYRYDIFGNLTWVKDPIGNQTEIKYDDLGRKIEMDDPYMEQWKYDYDEVDNLRWQKNGRGQEVVLQYDSLNRVRQKDYLTTNRQVIYTYDEPLNDPPNTYFNKGSLTTVAVTSDSPQIVTQYNYDIMGRQILEKRFIENSEYAISRHYDLAGRLDSITYPDGNRFDYTYHPLGHLKAVKEHGGYQVAAYGNYNALGQVGAVAYGNGTTSTYQYWEKTYRPRAMLTRDSSGAVIQSLSYNSYDNVGNILGISDLHNSVTQHFAYDAVNRLIQAQGVCQSDPTRAYEQAFTYDLAGNILQQTGNNAYQVLEQDSVGRPTRIDYSPEIADIGTRHVDYNQDNMPTRIVYKGQETTITYDGEDTRIKKVSVTGTTTSTVIYVGGLYEVRNDVHLLHIFANGKRIATVEGSAMHYFHTDHLNSTTVVTDQTGHEVEEMGYLPFGALLYDKTLQGGQWHTVYRFTGQEYDAEFALYNYNGRLYDPIMGRFISADPFMQNYYNPQNLNRYAYCLNNPLIYVDPTGHFWEEIGGFFSGLGSSLWGGFTSGVSWAWSGFTSGISSAYNAVAGFFGGGGTPFSGPGGTPSGSNVTGMMSQGNIVSPSSAITSTADILGLGGLDGWYESEDFKKSIDTYPYGHADGPLTNRHGPEESYSWNKFLYRDFNNFSAGLGDALLWGTGQPLRDLLGIGGIDQSSTAYKVGGWTSFAIGISRLAYAGLARGVSIVASSGLQASAIREGLRSAFRLGLAEGWRSPNLAKYVTDQALRAAAGRTNAYVNAYSAGVAVAGALEGTGRRK